MRQIPKNKKCLLKGFFRASPFIIMCVCLSVCILVSAIFAHSMDSSLSTILGNSITAVAAMAVVYVTLTTEKRRQLKSAKASAGMLSQILNSIYLQMQKIAYGDCRQIVYPSKWLDLYQECLPFLKYDYLDMLLREFEYVDALNQKISIEDTKQAKEMAAQWHSRFVDAQDDFNIPEVQLNLAAFRIDGIELASWKTQKEYKEFELLFKANYSNAVVKMAKEFLMSNDGSCDAREAANHIYPILKKEIVLSQELSKRHFMNNRELQKAIYAVFIDSFKDTSEIGLCWGELTLKTYESKQCG